MHKKWGYSNINTSLLSSQKVFTIKMAFFFHAVTLKINRPDRLMCNILHRFCVPQKSHNSIRRNEWEFELALRCWIAHLDILSTCLILQSTDFSISPQNIPTKIICFVLNYKPLWGEKIAQSTIITKSLTSRLTYWKTQQQNQQNPDNVDSSLDMQITLGQSLSICLCHGDVSHSQLLL